MRSRAQCFVDKSLAAMLAAIEIYNKPDFEYREESFSILATNAWELLLKARILQLSKNRLSAILEYERRRLTDGRLSQMLYRKKNRSGTHTSVGIFKALDILANEYGDKTNPVIRENLVLLVEIRDSAVHFLAKGTHLQQRVQELGSACLKNYLSAARQWFGVDLSRYNFFLMPLSFFRISGKVEAIAINAEEKKVLQYIERCLDSVEDDPEADYSLALRLNIQLVKATGKADTQVVLSNCPNAIPITVEEEQIRQAYPWTYAILLKRLQRRYSDFKQNNDFYRLKNTIEDDDRYCRIRLLDPGNPKSGKKKFYNPNILQEFDKHYRRQPLSRATS